MCLCQNKTWECKEEISLLPMYVHRFQKHFRNLPNVSSLSFLRDCIPTSIRHKVDDCITLEQALQSFTLPAYDLNRPHLLSISGKVSLNNLHVISSDDSPNQTSSARLFKSTLSGKYITAGHENPISNIEPCESNKPEISYSNDIEETNPVLEQAQITNSKEFTDTNTAVTNIYTMENESLDSSSNKESIVTVIKQQNN